MNKYLDQIEKKANLIGALRTFAKEAPTATSRAARATYTDAKGVVRSSSSAHSSPKMRKAKDVAIGASAGAAGGTAGVGANKYLASIRQDNKEEK